jgi:hypothetical protein
MRYFSDKRNRGIFTFVSPGLSVVLGYDLALTYFAFCFADFFPALGCLPLFLKA